MCYDLVVLDTAVACPDGFFRADSTTLHLQVLSAADGSQRVPYWASPSHAGKGLWQMYGPSLVQLAASDTQSLLISVWKNSKGPSQAQSSHVEPQLQPRCGSVSPLPNPAIPFVYRHRSWEPVPITALHTILHLRFCFQATQQRH